MSQTITVLTGTNRPQSNSRKIARILLDQYSALGVETWDLDLQQLPNSLFSPDAYADKPNAFRAMVDQVQQCDGMVVVCPEYNGSFPGILKYFIDMLPFPESFEHRPVAFVGLSAGMWGALRAVEQLQQIFAYRNGYVFPQRVFLPQIGDLLNSKGQLKDEDIASRMETQCQDFLAFVTRLRN